MSFLIYRLHLPPTRSTQSVSLKINKNETECVFRLPNLSLPCTNPKPSIIHTPLCVPLPIQIQSLILFSPPLQWKTKKNTKRNTYSVSIKKKTETDLEFHFSFVGNGFQIPFPLKKKIQKRIWNSVSGLWETDSKFRFLKKKRVWIPF